MTADHLFDNLFLNLNHYPNIVKCDRGFDYTTILIRTQELNNFLIVDSVEALKFKSGYLVSLISIALSVWNQLSLEN